MVRDALISCTTCACTCTCTCTCTCACTCACTCTNLTTQWREELSLARDALHGGGLDPPLQSVILSGGIKDAHMPANIALKSRRSQITSKHAFNVQALLGALGPPHELAPPLGGRGLAPPLLRGGRVWTPLDDASPLGGGSGAVG